MLKLGLRTMDHAYAVVHDLFQILHPGCMPIFTSDGLKMYFYALTAHFGRCRQPNDCWKPAWEIASAFLYAQLKKIHRRRRLVWVERRMLWGELSQLKDGLKALGLWRSPLVLCPIADPRCRAAVQVNGSPVLRVRSPG